MINSNDSSYINDDQNRIGTEESGRPIQMFKGLPTTQIARSNLPSQSCDRRRVRRVRRRVRGEVPGPREMASQSSSAFYREQTQRTVG